MQNIVARWEYRLQQKGVIYEFEVPYKVRKGLFSDFFTILCPHVGFHLALPVQLSEDGTMVIQSVYPVGCLAVHHSIANNGN